MNENKPEELVDFKKIADFNRFLGIDYGTEEHQLESKLGKFTGGTFTSDSSSSIY